VAVSLAQAAVNTQSDIDYAVIDNLRRYSWLLDQLVFDDTVTPGTGGGSLVYGYTQLTAAAPASFRAINSEYTPGQAARAQKFVSLKPLGGAFSVDRVLSNLGPQATNEVQFQMQQLLTAIRTRVQQEMILGDVNVDPNGVDGLSKQLVGQLTEKQAGYVAGSADWTPATVNAQAIANQRLDELDDWLSGIVPSHTGGGDQGVPGALPPGTKAILGNTKSIARIRSLARWAAMYTEVKDDLGRQIQQYGDWVLIDIGDRMDGSAPIIPISSTGTTDLFAVTFGLDSFHGASVAGNPLIQSWLPDFSISGAVKSGEIEMGPIALVLKNTRSAAALRGVKVQ
jgi:hypothetical protein